MGVAVSPLHSVKGTGREQTLVNRLWLVCILVFAWIVVHILHTLLVFGAAFAITLALAPVVRKTSQCRIPGLKRSLSWAASVVVVYAVVSLLLVVCIGAAVPVLVEQARTIAADIPQEMPRLQGVVDDWQQRFDHWKLPPRLKQTVEVYAHDSVQKLGSALVDGFDYAAAGLMSVFSWLLIVFAAYIIAIFLLLNLTDMQARFYSSIPEPYRTDVRGLVAEMNGIFVGYVRGTAILAVLVGLVNYVCLAMLGLVDGAAPFQYAGLVSALSVVGYLVPILGITATTLVGGLLAWFQFPSSAYVLTVVLILFVGSNAVDRLVGPKVLSKAIGVSPVFVVFAAFAGAELCGFWGMILGVPAAAVVKSVWIYVYQRFLMADELPVLELEPLQATLVQPTVESK